MPRGCLPGRLSFWFSWWLLSHYTWRPESSGERGNTSAWHTGPCEKITVIFRLPEIERQSEMRLSPAYQHYAQSDANGCHDPQRRHIQRSQPCNVCGKSILFGLHTNPPYPE